MDACSILGGYVEEGRRRYFFGLDAPEGMGRSL